MINQRSIHCTEAGIEGFKYILTTFHRQSHWCTQEFFSGGWGGSKNSAEGRGRRERGSGGGSPLVKSSGGSCNLVRGTPFHIVNFS